MKNLNLILLLLVSSCSQFQKKSLRFPANVKSDKRQIEIEVVKNRESVFANGVDSVVLEILIKESGKNLQVDPKEIKLLGNREFEQSDFKFKNGVYRGEVRPKVGSSDLKLMVAYQEEFLSEEVELKTYMTPRKNRLDPEPWQPSMSISISGISYRSDENALPHQFQGFEFYNYGNNKIVNTTASKYSNRQYSFEFSQHAAQNISFFVVDAPNSTTSEGMYSHLMLFPRKFLPHITHGKGNDVEVTLPTGEKIVIDKKSGELLGGVLKEGPVDISGDRFKRRYASLQYSGKGILLRANARGQMPQQGQFENTKIDLQDGNTGSYDVLIINGTTGERCRRPKSDFWSSADVQTILFKFPSDQEFDAYLRAKCKFGIPAIEEEPAREEVDYSQIAKSIWNSCIEIQPRPEADKKFLLNLKKDFLQKDIQNCLNSKIDELENEEVKREVAYDLYFQYHDSREEEAKELASIVKKQEAALDEFISQDLSWIKDTTLKSYESECRIQVREFSSSEMKFHDVRKVINSQIGCDKLKSKILGDVENSRKKLVQNFLKEGNGFKRIKKISAFESECLELMGDLVDSSFTYFKLKGIYAPVYRGACEDIKSSEDFKKFMLSSEDAIFEEVMKSVFLRMEINGEARADVCLKEYPANNPLNRIRFKVKRESCLMDSWNELEEQSSREAFKENGHTFNERIHRRVVENLKVEARRIQLKIMKERF